MGEENKLIRVNFQAGEKEELQASGEPQTPEMIQMSALLKRINEMEREIRRGSYNKGRYAAEKTKAASMSNDEISAILMGMEKSWWHLRYAYLKALIDTLDPEALAEKIREELRRQNAVKENPEGKATEKPQEGSSPAKS